MCPAEPNAPSARVIAIGAEGNPSPPPLASVLHISEGLRRVFGSPGYKPPMLPAVALEIHDLSCRPDIDTGKLIGVLERDPMLAGHVLRVANSPIFRGRDAETSLRSAVLRLGLKNLGEVVFELALHMRVFRSAEYSDLMEQLRRHSTACANLCRLLASRSGQDPENAFLCGLLHDIGIAAILIVLGERRKGEAAVEPTVLAEVIRQIHEDVSGMLVRLWKLPEEVADVVAHHHGKPAVEGAPLLSSVVALADHFATKLGFAADFGGGANDGADVGFVSAAAARLKLDATALATIEEESAEILRRVEQSLAHKTIAATDDGAGGAPSTKSPSPAATRPSRSAASSTARKSRPSFWTRIWRKLRG